MFASQCSAQSIVAVRPVLPLSTLPTKVAQRMVNQASVNELPRVRPYDDIAVDHNRLKKWYAVCSGASPILAAP
jgi:hypothetical protein